MPPFFAKVELPDISKTQDLGQFIGDVYTFAITIVAVLVFVVFLWAGWLYLTAAGNAANVGKAKTMMTNAIVGAIILLSAYLILYVINPDLVENTFNFKLPATGPASGLNYSPSDKLKLIDLAPNAGKAKDLITAIFQSSLTDTKVLWDGAEINAGEINPGEIIFTIPDNAAAGDHKVALKAGDDISNELVFKIGASPAAGNGSGTGSSSGSGTGTGGGGGGTGSGGGSGSGGSTGGAGGGDGKTKIIQGRGRCTLTYGIYACFMPTCDGNWGEAQYDYPPEREKLPWPCELINPGATGDCDFTIPIECPDG